MSKQQSPKIKFTIHFKDMMQDCLHWNLDASGKVISANLQTRIWAGSTVDPALIPELKPDDLLIFKNQQGEERQWKYPITQIEIHDKRKKTTADAE